MAAGTPELIVGRYHLYGVVASGGMATVHFGRLVGHAGFTRTVAIKRLQERFAHDAHFVSGMLDEARLSARIGHPNVVPTLDVVAVDEQLFLVMEYVQGESLSRLVRATEARGERIPLAVVVGVMVGVLHGLHAAHEATSDSGDPLNIVHRDVSPQNIIVGADGVPRVLDFGVAKAVGRLRDDTANGVLKGKLSYMAPEQITSEPVDRRTDVFAASVVTWELLTMKRLFAAASEGATVGNLLVKPIDPPSKHAPDVPHALDAIVMRGLSRAPKDRFPTARDMALALEKLVAPATAAQIGDWVTSLAKDALTDRAKRLREIESASNPSAPSKLQEIQDMPTVVPRASITAVVERRLAAYLGPHTAKAATKTFAFKAVGRGPETLVAADVPALVAALRPMLRTFIGRVQCEQVLADIIKELSS